MRNLEIQQWMDHASDVNSTADCNNGIMNDVIDEVLDDVSDRGMDDVIDAVSKENADYAIGSSSDSENEGRTASDVDFNKRNSNVLLPSWNYILESQSDHGSSLSISSTGRKKKKKLKKKKRPQFTNLATGIHLGRRRSPDGQCKALARTQSPTPTRRRPALTPIKSLQTFLPEVLPEWSISAPYNSEDEYQQQVYQSYRKMSMRHTLPV